MERGLAFKLWWMAVGAAVVVCVVQVRSHDRRVLDRVQKESETRARLRAFAWAYTCFVMEEGRRPETLTELRARMRNHCEWANAALPGAGFPAYFSAAWTGADAWSHEIHMTVSDDERSVSFVSPGPNGMLGDGDDIRHSVPYVGLAPH